MLFNGNGAGAWMLIGIFMSITFLFGYLLGSIPFGLIFSKMAGLGDVRAIGSGNIGATNVLRTGRKDIAALTLLFDALKGTAAVVLANYYLGDLRYACIAAAGAFLGHLFPIWLKFKGGKGVATFLGITLAFSPLGAGAFAIAWLSTALLTRYSSLSAIVASLLTPAMFLAIGQPDVAVLLFALALVLILKHKENIQRLLSGTEGKIGSKS